MTGTHIYLYEYVTCKYPKMFTGCVVYTAKNLIKIHNTKFYGKDLH